MGDTTCSTCGAPLESYEIYDPETGESVGQETTCPNEWRHVAEAEI